MWLLFDDTSSASGMKSCLVSLSPAKKPGVPAGWFISRGSRFGSPGPLVMSRSLKSV